MTLNVGDWVVPTLTVAPFDGSTVAALTVVSPAGVETALSPVTGNAGALWSAAAYELTASGEWVERWVVTGMGAGEESLTRYVEARQPAPAISGSYATTSDYYDEIGAVGPTNLALLLRRSSREVDNILVTAVYDITDTATARALMQATCEQVSYHLTRGETDGMPLGVQSVAIGSVQLSRGYSTGRGESDVPRFSEVAFAYLRNAGLTGHAPQTEPGSLGLGVDAAIVAV